MRLIELGVNRRRCVRWMIVWLMGQPFRSGLAQVKMDQIFKQDKKKEVTTVCVNNRIDFVQLKCNCCVSIHIQLIFLDFCFKQRPSQFNFKHDDFLAIINYEVEKLEMDKYTYSDSCRATLMSFCWFGFFFKLLFKYLAFN